MDYDYVEPDWTDPASLRACAARLKQHAAKMAVEMDKYRRFKPEPVAGDPFADIDGAEDPAVTEQRKRDYRTWQAKREIEAALAEEKHQEQQRQAKRNRDFYRGSSIGRLFNER
jgi:hypothetical protein